MSVIGRPSADGRPLLFRPIAREHDLSGTDSLPTMVLDCRLSVINLSRILAVLVCLTHLAEPWLCAQTVELNTPSSEVQRQMAALLAAQPRWSFSTEVETSFGYKDNLLLSSKDEESSTFVRSAVELLLLHVPRGRTDFTFFAQVDGTRFFSGRTVTHEGEAWSQAELGYRFTDTFKLSLPLTGYYYDQVFDVSDTDVQRLVAHLKVGGVMLGPTLRWAFHPSFWLEAQALGERKRYDDGVNDSRVGDGSLRLGWRPGKRIELQLEGRERWRDFDRRVQYSRAGRALTGTALKIAEREAEARATIELDGAKTWKSTTRCGVLEYLDNGSGYFSYDQKKLGQELTWKGAKWSLHLDAMAERIEFRVQTAGISIDPPPRIKDEYALKIRMERKVTARWSIFAGYTWERTRSNDGVASYILNEGLLGARWNWEK